MEIRDLGYFAVVAEHGNITRASEALGLSPPAVSKSLHRLEKSIDAKLMERTPKGVELTASGAALLAQVQRLRLMMRDVTREAADLRSGRAGHLCIGVSQVECEELPPAYAVLLRDASNLTLEIIVTNSDVMLPRLREGQLDMIINFLPATPYEGTVQEHLYDDEFAVCASANHRLAKRKRVSPADLAQERWASQGRNVHSWLVVQGVFQENSLPPPRIAVEARSLRVRLFTWACSDLVGITSKRLLQKAAPRFRLVQLPVKELTWRRSVGVIYRKDAYLPPAARRLLDLLKAANRRNAGR
jgi:DNA-binding transcriptional LysR family regulator